MNVSKKSKSLLFAVIGLVLVGIPLTVYLVQHQQLFQQFAWSTQQSAIAECSTTDGSAVIKVAFANTESSKDINVTANDLQTGTIIDLGTVKHQEVKSANIVTGKNALNSGSVLFKMTWADNSPGTDQLAATYKAISCPTVPSTNFCPTSGQSNQGLCEWDTLTGASGYTVVVKDTDTNTVIQSLSVAKDATQSAFPMTPGTAYQCTVTPTNECGNGTPTTSETKVCTIPSLTPSVSPTPPVCQAGTSSEGVCQWDAMNGVDTYNILVKDITTGQTVKSGTAQASNPSFTFPDNVIDTYECSVSAVNVCGETSPSQSAPSTCLQPTPTATTTPAPSGTSTPTPSPTSVPPTPTAIPTATPVPPTPTATPVPPTPTETPTPTVKPTPVPTATPVPPTPTPIVIVRTINQPPQQTIIRTTVQSPGQTQTIVQQGGQTVVQQPQSPANQTAATTPVPTVMPTGDTTPTYFLFGTSAMLLLAGGLIFFIL